MSVRVGDEIVAGGQGDMYTKAQVDALIANAIAQTTEKPGMIKPFAGTTVPTGYLLCDGSAVSRTTYASLFSAIGTTYGSGDGSTTFNLPNLFDKAPWWTSAGEAGATGDGGLPNLTGTFANSWATTFGIFEQLSGVFTVNTKPGYLPAGLSRGSASTNPASKVDFNAHTQKTAYSRNDNKVIPSYTKIGGWVIKY